MLEISFFAQVGTAINISSYHPTRKKKKLKTKKDKLSNISERICGIDNYFSTNMGS